MVNEAPTHLSLFSGVGGLDIAAEWAGFQTAGQCEWADYPTEVLEKHWPDVPRWRDIRTLTKGGFYERTGLRTVDVISGGFPCQPFSVAGKQKGREDDRYLWPEMLRIITEFAPRWVVGENVPGILRIAAADVVQDLERAGYHAAVFDFEAAAVGAPHRRERIAFVGHAERGGLQRHDGRRAGTEPADGCQDVSDADRIRCGVRELKGEGIHRNAPCHEIDPGSPNVPDAGSAKCDRIGDVGRSIEPGLGRMADGIPHWLDEPVDVPRIASGVKNRANRIKCLGNAVVPQQFCPIYLAIHEELSAQMIANGGGE